MSQNWKKTNLSQKPRTEASPTARPQAGLSPSQKPKAAPVKTPTPQGPTSKTPPSKTELNILIQQVSDLVGKDPSKAATILTHWIQSAESTTPQKNSVPRKKAS